MDGAPPPTWPALAAAVRGPTTFQVIDSFAGRMDDADWSRRSLQAPDTEAPVRTYPIGDPRTEAYLLKVEEMLVEARAFSARRALLRGARPPRRKARVWLGSILLAVGHRLLQSVPEPAASGVE